MANKQKYYAVKKGNDTGIFQTWSECQEAVKGFSGAEFKSFESLNEAQAYLNDMDIVLETEIIPRLRNGEVVAFVDGSYDDKTQAYGSGVYICTPNASSDAPIELSGRGTNKKYIELRNIAGEIRAVFLAVDWAWKNNYEVISIFYDYDGIRNWATGEWQTRTTLTQYYKKYFDEKKDVINIKFYKVSGHSNNKYNDRADALAKGAIASNKILRDINTNSGYIINLVRETEIAQLLDKLKAECTGLDFVSKESGSRKSWIVQFNDEQLTVSLFNHTKMMVQGKRSNLFQIITTGIIENINCGDFIQILKDAYEIQIDKTKVESDFQTKLPRVARIRMPENITFLIKQALINLVNPALSDIEFTMYTQPALRALEGVLKFNLQKCGIPMSSHKFGMFEIQNGMYRIKSIHVTPDNKAHVSKIESCYNHYYNQRHTLFHFGVILDETDVNTRLLHTKQEANDIINSTLKVINENYIT